MATLKAMPLPRLFGGIRKVMARQIIVPPNFQEGFGHYTDQNVPFQK